ncbi:MAG: hypothetical protein JSW14_01675 [Candidatus Bathyarchaeum sp.]|nr:MAG: hypothetical protein JSW14_01675 [Candidatus Bathyarchaeum sp.]
MAEMLKLKLNDLGAWLEQETTSLVEPLRADARKLLKDTQDRLADLLEASEKLLDDAEKEIAKGSRKTYRRAKLLQKISGNFANLINDLNIPDEILGESLHQVSEEIDKIVETISQERMKYFRAISPYFIMSRRRFDVALKRATDTSRNLQTFISEEYAKAESAEGVASKIEELRQSLTELNEAEKAKETREQRRELLEKKIAENQQNIQAIQSKDEVVELAQINARIKELEENIKHALRHLQKPFLKFQTLANSPSYSLSPDATHKLDEYLRTPFKALATEKEGYPLLRNILQKIKNAMEKGKLKLKKTRLRKAKDQIDNILNKTALESLHQNCRQAFSKKSQLAASGTISESRNKRTVLQKNLKDLQRKKTLLATRDAALEKKNQQIRARVKEQKKELERVIVELTSQNIQIITD